MLSVKIKLIVIVFCITYARCWRWSSMHTACVILKLMRSAYKRKRTCNGHSREHSQIIPMCTRPAVGKTAALGRHEVRDGCGTCVRHPASMRQHFL